MSLRVLAQLYHNPSAAHLVRNRTCSSRARETVKDKVTWVCSEVKTSSYKTFWLLPFSEGNTPFFGYSFPSNISPNIS